MVTDLMPITGTTDNDIVLIIEIIVKDHQRHDNHRYAKIIIEGRIIEGILKP
jgi:tagatose-1,6-bisphosphate aldolase